MEAYTYKLATRAKYKLFGGGALLFTFTYWHKRKPPFTILLCIEASVHRGHAQLTSTLGVPTDKLNRPGPCCPTLGYATEEKQL